MDSLLDIYPNEDDVTKYKRYMLSKMMCKYSKVQYMIHIAGSRKSINQDMKEHKYFHAGNMEQYMISICLSTVNIIYMVIHTFSI